MYVYFVLVFGVCEAALHKRKWGEFFLSIVSKLLFPFRVLMAEASVCYLLSKFFESKKIPEYFTLNSSKPKFPVILNL